VKGLLKRDIQTKMDQYSEQKEIIIITGVRRSGKSSLMRLVADDLVNRRGVLASNILYVNFEDERLISFTANDFETLYSAFLEIEGPKDRKYLFFDEIQNVEGWGKWLNRLYEFEDVKIYITGSNASLLSPEIATALTGRNRQVTIWPFSFREFLRWREYAVYTREILNRDERVMIKSFFAEYCQTGGFPEVLKTGDLTLLEQYYRDILYRDVIARYGIKNIKGLKEMALFLAANPGTTQSYDRLKSLMGSRSPVTAKNYLDILNNVYLFFCTDLYDFSLKRQIYNPSKVYAIDTAMMNAISFRFSQNLGHQYENLVFLELQRRGKDVFYGRSPKGTEVDFLLKKGLILEEAIQVSFSLEDRRTEEREIQGLVDVLKDLKEKQKDILSADFELVIVTDDEEREIEAECGTIKAMPIWKWLLLE
ncbi:MAG: ATP-binding protein, partial [Deltaproteobacteria bacterium]